MPRKTTNRPIFAPKGAPELAKLKKTGLALRAEGLIANSGWQPEVLGLAVYYAAKRLSPPAANRSGAFAHSAGISTFP
ncbi:hypothetical protein LRP30_07345 [Bradyrhizobium sp. C-145]|uniref:hypothetical protein n=1 Tax=Bradyrhizobium sp. C-145 TaxID=574727 RepID=UPI00201B65FD|nr:hypothetical protein [Bradyrhizobium sp. C-145]UQR65067.1 hypothetical protein LRP30_07345 [Bradyrhizobium sp. C-145]